MRSVAPGIGLRFHRFPVGPSSWLALFLAWFTWTLVAPALAAAAAPKREPLTSLEEVLDLPIDEAKKALPIKLHATVTYCHPAWSMLFVLGERSGAYINIPHETPQFRPGEVLEIEGETSVAKGYVELLPTRLHATGERRAPSASPWTISDLLSGGLASQWVEVTAKVQGTYAKDGRIVIALRLGTQNLMAYLIQPALETAREWIDATVRLDGVMSGSYDSRGQLIDVSLLLQETSQVQVLQPAPSRALALPFVPIARLQRPQKDIPAARVHIQGVVTTRLSPTNLVVSDRSGSIRIQALFDAETHPETSVEVLGYPTARNGLLALSDAVVLPIASDVPDSSESLPQLPPLDPALPLLESARAVHRLTRTEANRGYPVRLEAIVTYADAEWWLVFVQDQTDGINVVPHDAKVPLQAGQRVLVTGRSTAGGYAPIIKDARFEILGTTALPTPAEPTLPQMLSGQFDCRWAKLAGLVESMEDKSGRCTIYLRTRETQIPIMLSTSIGASEAARLVESRVTLQGVVGGILNPQGHLVGINFYVPNTNAIRIDLPPPTNRFEVAHRPIGELLRYEPDEEIRRIKIAGTLTSLAADGTVSVQDETGGMFVALHDRTVLPRLGDRVEISGYPTAGPALPTLADAWLRVVGSGPRLSPTNSSPKAILLGQHSAELVRMAGRLLEDTRLTAGTLFALQAEGLVIEGTLLSTPEHGDPAHLHAGSEVEITGVCRVQNTASGQIRGFQLLLREPADLHLLRGPPRLTLRSLRWLLGGGGILGAFALGWGLLLIRKNRQLREGEQRVRAILANVQTGIVIVSPQTRTILDANPVALAMLGVTDAEITGRFCHQFLCSGLPERCQVCDRGEAIQGVEHMLVRRDGTHLPILKTEVPVVLAGTPKVLISFVDVSERQAAQAALEKAKLAAEAASEAKSRFLAMMSHEIRTPLNGVIGILRLLPRSELSLRQQDWIAMAQSSANTLLRVINDILDFSKIEAGKLDLDCQPFELPRTITRAAAPFADRLEAKGLTWSMSLDPAAPVFVRGDADRVSQILGNLLGNALKFTEKGGVSLRLHSRPLSPTRTSIRIEVTDTGIGLTPEQIGRLFLPFSQVDNSAARRFGGTGLGLGICRQLAELMGGRIGVESTPGQGSIFWFEVPFDLATPEPEPEPDRPRPKRTIPPTPSTDSVPPPIMLQGRVLLAEDNEINQELAREIITSTGCQCDCVPDGERAVRAVFEHSYDLVFMDCMMPGMDGYAATQAIRSEEVRRTTVGDHRLRIAIVAMTANAMKGDREKCLDAGMDDYLSKPLDPDQVVAAMHKWMRAPVPISAPAVEVH